MPCCGDHPILDWIADRMEQAPGEASGKSKEWSEFSRESECIEFTDPGDGRRFEIVVREIDDTRDEEDE